MTLREKLIFIIDGYDFRFLLLILYAKRCNFLWSVEFRNEEFCTLHSADCEPRCSAQSVAKITDQDGTKNDSGAAHFAAL